MNDTRNPYAPPTASVEEPSVALSDAQPLITDGRRVPIGHCWRWISETFAIFFQKPWKWLGTMLLLLLMSMVVSLVPFSNLLTTALWPVVAGGIARALDVQRQTRSFALSDVFAGFGSHFLRLLVVGCVALLAGLVMFIIFTVMTSSEVAVAVVLGGARRLGTIPPNFWTAIAISAAVALPFTAATFLAAPLIMLHGVSPVQAMRMSFFGCVKNIVPWTLFGILMILVVLLSALLLLLGLFVTLPVACLAFYSMYRDVFIGDR